MSVSAAREDLLTGRIAGFFSPSPPAEIGVAVSGGSDSLALLVLLSDWRDAGGPVLRAVTVDHGLRPEAAAEAAEVAALCRGMDVAHDTLEWRGWDGRGNLADAARRARYGLMASWAESHGLEQVALGHTADDQAETLLMRLAREAGVDGLSAMSPRRRRGRVEFCRPVLDVTREELRAVLRARGLGWAEDPGNADEAYERVRARAALAALAPLGISAPGLARVAGHLAQVRDTLYWYVFLSAHEIVRFEAGDLLIDRGGFRAQRDEIARRLLQQALGWVGGAGYAPRGRAMDLLLEAIRGGTGMALRGCLVSVGRDMLRVAREPRAVAGLRAAPGALWDGRWRVTGPDVPGAFVAALGEAGLRDCPDRGGTGLPARSLAASPAVWREDTLLAAPLAGHGDGWHAELVRDEDDFFAAIVVH